VEAVLDAPPALIDPPVDGPLVTGPAPPVPVVPAD
jgi:hypothetical protein